MRYSVMVPVKKKNKKYNYYLMVSCVLFVTSGCSAFIEFGRALFGGRREISQTTAPDSQKIFPTSFITAQYFNSAGILPYH